MKIELTNQLILAVGFIAALVTGSVALGLAHDLARRWNPEFDQRMASSRYANAIVGMAILAISVGSFYLATKGTGYLLSQMPTGYVRPVLGTCAIAALGGILFSIKTSNLREYSLIEIAFALFIAWQTTSRLQDVISPLDTLSILAAAYLMTRGIENFKKDLDARREKEKPSGGG